MLPSDAQFWRRPHTSSMVSRTWSSITLVLTNCQLSGRNQAQLIATMQQVRALKGVRHQDGDDTKNTNINSTNDFGLRSSLRATLHQHTTCTELLKALKEETQALRLVDHEDLATYVYGFSNDRQKQKLQVCYAILEERLNGCYQDVHTCQPILIALFRPSKTGDVTNESFVAVSLNVIMDILSANEVIRLLGTS
jgi:hypothetical protein